jgi:hypothetical protein
VRSAAPEDADRRRSSSRRDSPPFDPADFETHLRETLGLARDNFVELIFRDTCRLNGAMKDRLAQACRIVRRLTGREAGSRL